MVRKPAQIEAENKNTSTIELLNDGNSEEFPDIENDLEVKEAEIISETRIKPEDLNEVYTDEFSQFLDNLPADADASFLISRLPDRNLKGEFRTPCNVLKHVETIYWNGETKPEEIYAQITAKHGGGKYMFQIRQGKGFGKSWTQVLADPPHLTEIEKALRTDKEETKSEEQARNNAASQVFANLQRPTEPTDAFAGMRQFMTVFQEIEAFKQAIKPPEPTVSEPAPAQPEITADTIKLKVIEKAIENPELLQMAVMSVFKIPAEVKDSVEGEQGNFLVETFKFAFSHPNETKAVIETVVSGFGSFFAPIISRFSAPPAQPPPTANFGLDSFRMPRNEPPAAPMAETQPQPQQSPAAPVFEPQPQPESAKIPFVALED